MAGINAVNKLEGMDQAPLARQNVAAAGTVIANAAALSVGVNRVTGGDGTVGVVMPAANTANGPVIVFNASASNLKVYPTLGTSFADGTANSELTIAARQGVVAYPMPNGNWGAIYD